jgi:hypothetical protein
VEHLVLERRRGGYQATNQTADHEPRRSKSASSM